MAIVIKKIIDISNGIIPIHAIDYRLLNYYYYYILNTNSLKQLPKYIPTYYLLMFKNPKREVVLIRKWRKIDKF